VSNQQSNIKVKKYLWEAVTLNPDLYEDALRNQNAIKLARIVVILAAVSYALGSSVIGLIYRPSLPLLIFVFLINGFVVLIGYYFWTFIIWKLGQWLHLRPPAYKNLLAPIGLAHTPQVLNFLTVIPLFGRPIEIGLSTWSLLAVIAAVKRGLDLNFWQAIVICASGWLLVEVTLGVVQVISQNLL
jgi:hypothetical protein